MEYERTAPVFLLLFLIISWASCTVREDRSKCPCRLSISFISVPEGGASVRIDDGNSLRGMNITRDTLLYADAAGPRTLLTAHTAPSWSTDGYRIPEGEQCPELYLSTRMVNTACESQELSMTLRKCFCWMSLNVRGEKGSQSPYSFRVRGNVNGVNADGSPSAGPFSCEVPPSLTLRLPRQLDGSLLLDIVAGNGTVRTFPLGRYLSEAGYSWLTPDLEDVSLDVELSVTKIYLTIDGWGPEYPLYADI